MHKKLKRLHHETLSRLAASPDAQLRRLPGGFWVTDPSAQEYQQGEWCVSISTLKEMVELGYIQLVAGQHYIVTDLGCEALNSNS